MHTKCTSHNNVCPGEMRFIKNKDKRDKIIRKSETELKDVARNLNAVRK